jgi:hypothetical protein
MWGIKNPFIYAGTVVFLVVVIVAFVFFPTTAGAVGSGGSISFGSWAGKAISYAQGSYMVQEVQAISQSNPSSDNSDTANQLRNYQIYRNAFELTVVHEAIVDEVTKAGVVIPDQLLDEKMAALAQFQENGSFSTRLFRQMSTSQRLGLRNQLRADLVTQAYTTPVYGVAPSSKEIEFVKAMTKETRSIEYAVLPIASYPESELAAWATANAGLFTRAKLSRITLSAEADAKKVRDQITGGMAFPEAAKSRSTDSWAGQGGDMGLRFFHELVADLATKTDADKVIALAQGGLSPVLKTTSGSWAIYRVDGAPLPAVLTDPAVLADARAYMEASERGKMEDWVMAKAKAFAAESAKDFAANAKKAGAIVKAAGPFPINYGNLQLSMGGQSAPLFTPVSSSGTPELASAARSDAFLSQAFSLAPGAISSPMILGENVIVFRVKEAGTAAADDGLLSLYYPYLYQQKIDEDVRSTFLKSPKLKDQFMDVYLKYFTGKPGQ